MAARRDDRGPGQPPSPAVAARPAPAARPGSGAGGHLNTEPRSGRGHRSLAVTMTGGPSLTASATVIDDRNGRALEPLSTAVARGAVRVRLSSTQSHPTAPAARRRAAEIVAAWPGPGPASCCRRRVRGRRRISGLAGPAAIRARLGDRALVSWRHGPAVRPGHCDSGRRHAKSRLWLEPIPS